MKHLILSIVLVAAAIGVRGQASPAGQVKTTKHAPAGLSPVELVNPIIGTNGMGHTFPGACVPHGAVQLSPDTDTVPHNVNGAYQPGAYAYCAGYQYRDSTIVGFSHTHMSGTGHSDLGDILLMPFTGKRRAHPGTAANPDAGYRSRFSHDTERATPGYYEVLLADYGVKARLTATERVGVHAYAYPAGENRQLLVDLQHGIYNYDGKTLWASIRVENDTLLTGYRVTNGWARVNYTYFAISFSRPIKQYGHEELERPKYTGFWRKFDTRNNFPDIGGRKIVAFFEFGSDDSQELVVKVALSGVSASGALANLRAEASGRSFDQLAGLAREKWARELDVIDARGTDDQLAMLYTSLYHALINPSVYMDVDRQYRGVDGEAHAADGFTNYTVFSLWDTYRALHPLFNLLHPSRNRDMAISMLSHQRQSVHGALPVWSHMGNENWCMIGYHAVSVLSDALAKGVDIDPRQALEAMVSSSNIPYYENTGDYLQYGYVPAERNGNSASITLEYAYDDWTIHAAAARAGQPEVAEKYRQRALSYRNVIDPSIGFARPRLANGDWKDNFNILDTHGQGFIEGNSLNYTFHVPQDVAGLIRLTGGDKAFIAKLDSLFTTPLPDAFFEHTEDVTREGLLGGYVHGNEPSHHVAYLYAWTSEPWKTQYWTREIMNRMYRNNIDGLCGNDDCGQMSAWYLFTAMGFYPVCPGTDQYVLGAPYLPYLRVTLENGRALEIKAPGVSDKRRYVSSVRLNGKPYDKRYITHADIAAGGTLEFEMSARPATRRVAGEMPYSLSNEM
ncbi:MAG: GH92 family glycosyl hydrolase [Odoribacteraceae bacterium]|jgi:predicted alpha-1,2-mannosidase|nr:GH92 family glycosyl hydrolase [Odoribacteraceae bacterium]